MADTAHRLTDEKLEEMEKRLSAIYSRAEKEIQKTADEYFSKFAKQDEAKRKLVEQGKLTEDEYTKWRKGKVMYGKRFTEMKEQCAKQLLNVNQTALAYVNGELPEVYAINYNALESAVDGVGGYSFTLVDADTVRNLAVTDTSLLPYKDIDPKKDIPWNMKKINAETLQGILQGESMDKIAKRLRNVQEMNRTQAIRSARTIVTGAENKGRQDSYARAEADGIILQKEWLATNDGRTRHSHAMLDGAIVDQDKKFENGLMYPGDPNGRPEEVYNCFVGETKVASDSDVVRSYKHKYDGKIISIKTAGGVQFSCTPNHPILTPNGWVAAELLNNGNNILVTFGENNVFSRVNPNINHRFPRIDTIHKFGKKLRSKRTSCLGVDFHGDVATSNVEIITHKRFLGDVRNSSGRNGVDKFLFKLSNKTLSCFGPLFKHFWSVCKTSFCFIGCKCKSLPFFKCSVGHSCEHGFGTIANRDSVLTEYSINDLPADTVIDGELLDRLSCKVFLDTIVNVDVSVLSTHVYNLQTENGYYFVNSIVPQDAEKSNGIFAIAKNCRCTLVAKVNGFKKVQVQKAMAEKQEPQRIPVNGKDLVGDIDYSSSKFDYDIETALNAQGFDGLPRVVSNEEFEEALKKSNFYAERTYCAPTQEVLDEYRNQLYNGKWYVDCSEGGAQYGQGMYCAARFENGKYIIPNDNKIGWEMSHYQEIGISKGNKFSYTEGITLTPDAKIFTLYEDDTDIINRYAREYALKKANSEDMRSVIREMIDIQEKIDRSSNSNFVGKVDWDFVDKLYDERARIYDTNKYKDEINKLINEGFSKAKANPGALAAEMGYDAINAQGHGESGSYTVILNRTKCIFREGGSRYGN